MDLDEVCALVKQRIDRGKTFSLVVVAEGFTMKDTQGHVTQDDQVDDFGHVRLGGIGEVIGAEIERRARIETRVTTLGYIQRGGSPTPYDRVLATRYGVTASDLLHSGDFGKMVALQGSKIGTVPLSEVTGRIRTVDMELYDIAQVFFG